jgi:hypothetical protein
MNKLTTMTRALSYYGFLCDVNVTDNPQQEDHEVQIAPNIYVQVPSMGEGPYLLWFIDKGIHTMMTENTDAHQMAKHIYNMTKGV